MTVRSNEISETSTRSDAKYALCAIIVWYEPQQRFLKNIISILPFVSKVIIVDNSSHSNGHMISDNQKIDYFWQGQNTGIAAALNFGMHIAEREGFRFAVTLDQDSFFTNTNAAIFFHEELKGNFDSRVAIIAPLVGCEKPRPGASQDTVITSGNIVRVSAWKQVGGFNELLFIDQVDHDFCFRLRRSRYLILQSKVARMEHTIGDPVKYTLLGRPLTSSNHSPQRRYYMARNRLYLRKMFPEFPRPYIKMYVFDIVGILWAEQQKCRKLFAIVLGVLDYARCRFGRRDL